MNTIPPNNLDQLIAWIRLFAQETNVKLQGLQKNLQELRETLKKEKKWAFQIPLKMKRASMIT